MRKCVEIDLDEFSDEELCDVMRKRGYIIANHDILVELEREGCPSELLQRLKEWDRQPIPNLYMLKRWKEFCQSGKAEV